MTEKHTVFAMKALSLADMFKAAVGERPVGQATSYRAEMAAPEGPSTGGGKQAVQHIRLVAESGAATLVAGSANQVEGAAELRSYEYLQWMHAQRFKGAPLPLEKAEYDAFLQRCQKFLANSRLKTRIVQPPPDAIDAAGASSADLDAPAGTSMNQKLVLALIGGIAVVVVVVLVALLRSN